MRIRLSSRKSDLARLQTQSVKSALIKAFPSLDVTCFYKESLGDVNLTDPLWKIPEKGVFTEDFQHDLLQDKTDAVVHSWKDLPTEPKDATYIVATLPRADSRDLLLIKKSCLKNKTMKNLVIYSSSPRRAHNLSGFFQEYLPLSFDSIEFQSVRGNIQTRVRKLLEAGEVHGLIVAKAALDRLLSAEAEEFSATKQFLRQALSELNWCVLPWRINPNAAAQGAIAIEILKSRTDLISYFEKINHCPTYQDAEAERQCLRSFGGGCHQKIGISIQTRGEIQLKFMRGVSEKGLVLDHESLETESPCPKFLESEMYYVKSDPLFTREYLVPTHRQITPLYISHPRALQTLEPNGDPIWTAGLSTWKALSTQGVWVHGCSEGLGEETPDVSVLSGNMGTSMVWTKISHSEAPEFETSSDERQDSNPENIHTMKILPTYQLISRKADDPLTVSTLRELQCRKAFFWTSFKAFQRAVELEPNLLDKFHFSGPGNTAKSLKKFFRLKNLPQDKLFVVLDGDEWRRKCQK